MKKLLFPVFCLFTLVNANAQNNIFPSSGNVGIGTTSPNTTLQVNGGGIKLTNSSGYPNGINIDMNIASGWARELGFSYGGTGKLFSFGAYGTGNILHYGYIGGNTSSVSAYSHPWMVFLPNGKVGIGTKSPSSPLEVHESSNSGGSTVIIDADADFNPNIVFSVNGARRANIRVNDQGNDQFQFQVGPSLLEAMSINTNGNVGIGTSLPQSKLAVNGTITAQKVRVTQTGWPDYVFDSTYHLLSLKELQNFIIRHKHLPESPSAKEITKSGLDLGIMQKIQMQKIEELTLYIIMLQNQISQLTKMLIHEKKDKYQLKRKLCDIEESLFKIKTH